MTPLITEMSGAIKEDALNYKWFDVSEAKREELVEDTALDLLRQPFPFEQCAVVGLDVDGNKYAFFVHKAMAEVENGTTQECIRMRSFCKFMNDHLFQLNPSLTIDISGGHLNKSEATIDDVRVAIDGKFLSEHPEFLNNQEMMNEAVTVSMNLLVEWLQVLDKKNIEVHTPIKRSNHAKRIRQGKKPFYDWHTVTIEPSKPAAPHKGGTHASPRLHEVRGHWVVNRNGKRFWRRPHERGDAALGISFHDYKIKGEAHG